MDARSGMLPFDEAQGKLPPLPLGSAPRSGSGTGCAGTTVGWDGISVGGCHGEARIARTAGDGEGGDGRGVDVYKDCDTVRSK